MTNATPEHQFSALIDPLFHYRQKYEHHQIIEMLGFIPNFFKDALENHTLTLAESMAEAYGFPSPVMNGGDVATNGVYTYPQDPPLYPLAFLSSRRGVVWLSTHGITAICEIGQKHVMYRFD